MPSWAGDRTVLHRRIDPIGRLLHTVLIVLAVAIAGPVAAQFDEDSIPRTGGEKLLHNTDSLRALQLRGRPHEVRALRGTELHTGDAVPAHGRWPLHLHLRP